MRGHVNIECPKPLHVLTYKHKINSDSGEISFLKHRERERERESTSSRLNTIRYATTRPMSHPCLLITKATSYVQSPGILNFVFHERISALYVRSKIGSWRGNKK